MSWTDPGVHAVAPGVHRIVCPLPKDGLKAVNVYVMMGGGEIALIDTGWRSDAIIDALEAGFASLGASLRDLTAIVATHSHYDHYGLSAYLREQSGAPVYLGERERENLAAALVREEFERDRAHRRALLLRHGARALADELAAVPFTFESVQRRGFASWPDHWVADGEELRVGGRVLQARLTPGHSRGHLMFVSDDLLFAGDHVLPHITPSLGLEAFTDGRALEAFLASLRASRDLDVRLVLPGHGPVFEALAGRVDELLAHHDTRLAACLDALADAPLTAHDVAARLTWTRRERPFADMDLFNRMLATTETITHLELLADHGDVAREQDGEVVRYAAALTVWSKTSAPSSIR
jgi:glyoxylase-like metal-dependent hydrolase (beta-lactamase superfamily II)